jgi:phosphoribosylformylglycinamidine synthase
MKFTRADDEIILLGNNKNVIGGSEFLNVYHDMVAGMPPEINFEKEKALQNLILKAIKLGLLNCAHDISLGGLSVALTQMTTDQLGFDVDVKAKSIGLRFDAALFGETQSRIIVSVAKEKKNEFLKLAAEYKTPYHELGKVVSHAIHLRLDGESVIKTDTATVRNVLEQTLPAIMAER